MDMRLVQPDAPSASGEIRADRPTRPVGPVRSSPHGALPGCAGSWVDRSVVGPLYRRDRTLTSGAGSYSPLDSRAGSGNQRRNGAWSSDSKLLIFNGLLESGNSRCRDTQWKSTGVRGCAVDSWTTGPRTSLAISARSPSEAADPEEVCRRSCGRSSPGRSGAGRPPGVARLRCRARHGATRPGRWLTAGAEVAVVVARGPPARLDGVARRLRAPRR